MKRGKITVGQASLTGNDNTALQRAVDDLAEGGGGTVELPAGTFEMRDALRLRSGVTVVGQGPETVLRKAPSVSSPLADWLGYGHYEVTVKEPDLFEPGMGVLIEDADAGGFYVTAATITAKDGNALFIDRMLNHDYHPARGGRIVSVFPLVCSEGVENVALRNLTLDGGNDAVYMNGCRGGGVFLLRTHAATIEGVEVLNYNGDAVSFQQCSDILVQNSHLHHNEGCGLHPGSGSVRYVMSHNHIHHNGGDGIFYCLRTTYSRCESNEIHDNGRAGISIGERDTDHMVRSNEIYQNGGPGVLFRKAHFIGGDRVVLHGNAFRRNCQRSGEAEIVVEE
ncbi:MAG: right-handed parallel beta-helix repeat-containing protein, partial [Candidatus Brocadiae bacterium]|nr:right-handed parallel beta-helix repeat-containing protein [Candidatus Brocadiia bacterium]